MSEDISTAQSWVLVDEGAEPAQHEESVVGQSDPIVDPIEPEEQQNGHEGLVNDAPVVPAIKLDLAAHTSHESTDSHPVDAEHQEFAHSDSTEDCTAPHIWKQGTTPRSLEASSSSTCTLADSAFLFFIVFNYAQKSPHFRAISLEQCEGAKSRHLSFDLPQAALTEHISTNRDELTRIPCDWLLKRLVMRR